MKKKLKVLLSKILRIINFAVISAIILGGTLLVYYYAKGYRINIDDGSFRKTGVLSIESLPSKASIFVDNESKGKTPKSIPSVDEKSVSLKLTRDGYRDWAKTVSIVAEKSSPIYAQMILTDFNEELVYEFQEEIVSQTKSKDGKYLFIQTKSTDNAISIWRYDIYRSFWDLSLNPQLIYTVETPKVEKVNILPSPDGRLSLVEEMIGDEITSTYLLHTIKNGDLVQELNLLPYYTDNYTVSWSENSKYLVLESVTDIVSINTSNNKKFILHKKTAEQSLVWTTDSQGYFYMLTEVIGEDGNYYTLNQTTMEGSENKAVIEKIYSYGVDRYVKGLTTTEIEYAPFTNSPENTKFAGDITSISVNQDTEGIFIKTTSASYWYDLLSKKYVIISSSPSELIEVSQDLTKLIFQDQLGIGVFTFDKETSDPTTQLGSKYVLTELPSQVSWLDETYLLYETDTSVNLIDYDGDNNYEILSERGITNLGNLKELSLHSLKGNSIFKYDLDTK